MLDAFGADERVGNLLDMLCFTLNDQDLEAVIVIQMDVNGGNDIPVIIVLQTGQLLIEKAHMMVVNQRHGAHHFAFG